jgi:hypothetical protein
MREGTREREVELYEYLVEQGKRGGREHAKGESKGKSEREIRDQFSCTNIGSSEQERNLERREWVGGAHAIRSEQAERASRARSG